MRFTNIKTSLLVTVLINVSCGGGGSSGGSVTPQPITPPEPQAPIMPAEIGAGPAGCVNGMADIFPCDGISLAKRVSLSDMGGNQGNDSWGWVDQQDGHEYALMGLDNRVSIVDITSPEEPVIMGHIPTQTISSTWRDVKVYADHAYIVADSAGSHGLQVFDLTRIRGVTGEQTFMPDIVYSEFNSAHNIAINESSGFAYVVGSNTCAGGPHMVDINTPGNPMFAGCHDADGNAHDLVCVNYAGPDTDYTGKEICFVSNGYGEKFTIVDTSDKTSTVTVASFNYPEIAFVHQAWLTEDHQYLFINDELDELNLLSPTRTYVIELTDLDDPNYLYVHEGTNNSTDHNLYVKGNLVYEANYKSGLRILEFDDLATDTLVEVAFFDTYPADDLTGFSGAWNVYPFFPSGTLIVSDVDRGLFVLTMDE